jgi:hypothetical protein
MKIWHKIKSTLIYPAAYTYLTIQSNINWIKSLFQKSKVHFEKPYSGQKIVLVALYEKGCLREDIENLFAVVKRKGAYLVGVNTLKLDKPGDYDGLIDCYIERFNFGRDFGSYKAGLKHLRNHRWDEKCPRLLILNDSLFYSKNNLDKFISDLLDTEIEVLGATENHEIEHHLGSFCLSLDGSIIRKSKFKAYWEKYSNSDVRPLVIHRGEMELSKTLRKCVSSQNGFCALYDLTWLSEYLYHNKDFLDCAPDFYRMPSLYQATDFVDWKRPSLNDAATSLFGKYLVSDPGLGKIEAKIEAKLETSRVNFVADPKSLHQAIVASVKEVDSEVVMHRIYDEIKNNLLECFSAGSQIHQNAIIFHHLGLPIIKLDGLYRGMFSHADIEKLAQQLEPDEAMKFKRLMYSKPFGGDVLFGWKRAAFYRGLI